MLSTTQKLIQVLIFISLCLSITLAGFIYTRLSDPGRHTLDWSHPRATLSYEGQPIYIEFREQQTSYSNRVERYDISTEDESTLLATIWLSDWEEAEDYDPEWQFSDSSVPAFEAGKFGQFLEKEVYLISPESDYFDLYQNQILFKIQHQLLTNISTIEDLTVEALVHKDFDDLPQILINFNTENHR